MSPSAFDEENFLLHPPQGMTSEQVAVVSAARAETQSGIPCIITCWRFSSAELEEMKATGRVWLVVMGETQPPVSLCGISPFKPVDLQHESDSDG